MRWPITRRVVDQRHHLTVGTDLLVDRVRQSMRSGCHGVPNRDETVASRALELTSRVLDELRFQRVERLLPPRPAHAELGGEGAGDDVDP